MEMKDALKVATDALETAQSALAQAAMAEADEQPAAEDEYEYPDVENAGFMKQARETLARLQAGVEYEANAAADMAMRDFYQGGIGFVRYTNARGSTMYGFQTPPEAAMRVRPYKVGYWDLIDGGSIKVPGNSPEGKVLADRLAEAQEVWDAAQAMKAMRGGRGTALQRFLEEGSREGFRDFVTKAAELWSIYVDSWPSSKYAPQPIPWPTGDGPSWA